MLKISIFISLFLLVACQPSNKEENVKPNSSILNLERTVEAIPLMGDTIYSPELKSSQAFDNYEQAKTEYQQDSSNPDAIIWYGRRTAYLGYFQKAIEIYTAGIQQHPDDARFYRHRGHRFISTRQYDRAIADFEKAVDLINDQPDQIEPDGLPNEKNIPLTTLHSNIWYHLGLAYYLKNDLEKALDAFNNRTVTQKYDDNIVSGGHWRYMINRRLNKNEAATMVIKDITDDMDIIENGSYYRMCLFYNGAILEKDLKPEGIRSSADDVLNYGLGNWYLYQQQDTANAKSFYTNLLQTGNKFSFAYLAAESDWKRMWSKIK